MQQSNKLQTAVEFAALVTVAPQLRTVGMSYRLGQLRARPPSRSIWRMWPNEQLAPHSDVSSIR
jgi:hypothetical protein